MSDQIRVDILTSDPVNSGDVGTTVSDVNAAGAHDGSSLTNRELATWYPPIQSADADILSEKELLDARSVDMSRNDGYVAGAAQIHKDSIVGSHFKLNAQPDIKFLKTDKGWAEEFQQEAESKFTLYAESPDRWLDASGHNTLTSMIRLVVGTYLATGEGLGTAEWLRDQGRPYNTAIQLIDVNRLSTPNNLLSDPRVRNGIEVNKYGKPVAYHMHVAQLGEVWGMRDAQKWKRVAARKPWGRKQVIHVFEQMRVSQSRGVGDMVSSLKQMKMTKKFQDITLQQAVVGATYAASITSELPPTEAFQALGLQDEGFAGYASQYLEAIATYTGSSKNTHIDGVKIPHLYPGTKLNLDSPGVPAGMGGEFEQSMLRYIASSLGLSYEQFSRDYTNTNYSSARASMGETWKFMQSRKKIVADSFATDVYSLWLEEAWNKGDLPKPSGVNFYDGQTKDALCKCSWIGASRGQIDELKETQAAILRIKSGLSTYEKEIGKLGEDYRDVFDQRAREEGILKEKDLPFILDTNKNSGSSGDTANQKNEKDDGENES